MQVQKTIAGRHDILKEVSLKDYNDPSKDPKHSWNQPAMVSYDQDEVEAKTLIYGMLTTEKLDIILICLLI